MVPRGTRGLQEISISPESENPEDSLCVFFLSVTSPLLTTPSSFGEGLEEDSRSILVTAQVVLRGTLAPLNQGALDLRTGLGGIGAQGQILQSGGFSIIQIYLFFFFISFIHLRKREIECTS